MSRRFLLGAGLVVGALGWSGVALADAGAAKVDSGDTAWLLVSTALVMLMTPGLALFYGGMVRARNVLATFMYSFIALAAVTIAWVVVGYSLAFGTDHGGVIGGFGAVFLRGVGLGPRGTIPALLFMAYQLMFAIITPALISGAVAERVKFSAYALFAVLWSLIVYCPVAHWVWGDGGWLARLGALDFAGGTVVHLISGISALVFALVLGPRLGHPREKVVPHNLTLTVLGAGLLWFGWFGFNGGSALGSNGLAALAFTNTHLAAATAAGAWAAAEWLRNGRPSMLGLVSGLVAGLVAITPAAGFVGPMGALAIGLCAGVVCYGAVLLKERLGYDDSLDAFGIHGIGGFLGALLTGVFASRLWNPAGADGLIHGNLRQVGVQSLAAGVAAAYAAVVTYGLLKLVDALVGLRVDESSEVEGLDLNLHGERGYAFDLVMSREARPTDDEEALEARRVDAETPARSDEMLDAST
ncbi:MAG TPA: ammonium transporter [Polyangia bacterium]|jgi:Amt family ammonium transporter